MLRTLGTVFLAIGFIMLAVAWEITDPVADDANIGAGGLLLLGRFIGSIGLVLAVVDVALSARRRRIASRMSL